MTLILINSKAEQQFIQHEVDANYILPTPPKARGHLSRPSTDQHAGLPLRLTRLTRNPRPEDAVTKGVWAGFPVEVLEDPLSPLLSVRPMLERTPSSPVSHATLEPLDLFMPSPESETRCAFSPENCTRPIAMRKAVSWRPQYHAL